MAYSLRERDGKLQWIQYLFGSGLPSLAEGGLFLTSGCYYYRLSPNDGTIVWWDDRCAGGGPTASAYAKGRLYVPDYPAGNIIDAADGSVTGNYPTYHSTPAVFTFGRKLLGVSQQNDTTIGCWNAKTGELLWQVPAEYEIQAPPIVVNGVVYFTDALANLYALNPKNGKKIWSENVGDLGPSPMLSAGQDTLVVTNDTKVIAYRPQ